NDPPPTDRPHIAARAFLRKWASASHGCAQQQPEPSSQRTNPVWRCRNTAAISRRALARTTEGRLRESQTAAVPLRVQCAASSFGTFLSARTQRLAAQSRTSRSRLTNPSAPKARYAGGISREKPAPR